MSGYSKQLMEIAAAWLRTNPDPTASIQLPRKLDELERLDAQIVRTAEMIRDRKSANDLAWIPRFEKTLAELKALRADPQLVEQIEVIRDASSRAYRLSQSKIVAQLPGETDPLWYANEAQWLLAWARDGYNVFDLSPDFVAAMLLTDPTEVDLPALKLPFGGILLTISDGFAVGAEGTSYTKIHVAEVADCRELATPGAEKQPALVIYASDGVHLLCTVARRGDLSWEALEALPDDVEADTDKEARQTIQRIVFGAIAYATTVEGAITTRFPSFKKKVQKERALAHWTIGRTIKIDPKLVVLARAGSREVAFRVKTRFVVRGHYRNQAHGAGRALRTRLWIAPHWRGPDEGAQLVHTYKPETGAP